MIVLIVALLHLMSNNNPNHARARQYIIKPSSQFQQEPNAHHERPVCCWPEVTFSDAYQYYSIPGPPKTSHQYTAPQIFIIALTKEREQTD